MSRALAFVEDVASRHGEDLGNGLVRVRRSQASLATEAACSAGTIAYYLRQAGTIVVRRDDGLVIDREALNAAQGDELARRRRRATEVGDALSQRWGQARLGDDSTVELVGPDGRSPSLRDMADSLDLSPSATQRHLEALERQGRLLRHGRRLYLAEPAPGGRGQGPHDANALTPTSPSPVDGDALNRLVNGFGAALLQFGQQLVDLAQASAAVGHSGDTPRSDGAQGPRDLDAQLADSRDGSAGLAETVPYPPFEKDKKSFFLREAAKHGDETRGVRGQAPITERAERLSSQQDVTQAIAPLVAACQRQSLPHLVDEEGRRWLALYNPEELARAVAEVLRLLNNEGALRSPLGLLVAKAKRGDESFFAEPASVAPKRPDWLVLEEELQEELFVDEEAAQAVGAMGPEELAQLDDAVRRRLRVARLWEFVSGNPAQLATHRCRTVRERWQSQGADAGQVGATIGEPEASTEAMPYAGAGGQ